MTVAGEAREDLPRQECKDHCLQVIAAIFNEQLDDREASSNVEIKTFPPLTIRPKA